MSEGGISQSVEIFTRIPINIPKNATLEGGKELDLIIYEEDGKLLCSDERILVKPSLLKSETFFTQK